MRASLRSRAASADRHQEMLRLCLGIAGPTHAAEKSYNNHWGVPLTLARMPPDSALACEIGMNHVGEIRRGANGAPARGGHPDGEPVHLGFFPTMRPSPKPARSPGAGAGGTAVLLATTRLPAAARARARRRAQIVTFATTTKPIFALWQVDLGPKGSSVIAGTVPALPLPRGAQASTT